MIVPIGGDLGKNRIRSVLDIACLIIPWIYHPFAIDAARAILGRPEISGEHDIDAKVEQLDRLVYGRLPSTEIATLAREFLASSSPGTDTWRAFAQALPMANEFVFVD